MPKWFPQCIASTFPVPSLSSVSNVSARWSALPKACCTAETIHWTFPDNRTQESHAKTSIPIFSFLLDKVISMNQMAYQSICQKTSRCNIAILSSERSHPEIFPPKKTKMCPDFATRMPSRQFQRMLRGMRQAKQPEIASCYQRDRKRLVFCSRINNFHHRKPLPEAIPACHHPAQRRSLQERPHPLAASMPHSSHCQST